MSTSPATSGSRAIIADQLVMHFGDVHALQGVSFEVPTGSVLGLLGPNGAGKTTAVRILTTILKQTSGYAEVAGVDVSAHPNEVRRRIGLAGQYAAVDENLTGHENLTLVGKLNHLAKSAAVTRAGELLEQFHLTDAAHRPVRTYSGVAGQYTTKASLYWVYLSMPARATYRSSHAPAIDGCVAKVAADSLYMLSARPKVSRPFVETYTDV